MQKRTERIKELVDILNQAARAYYQESREIMSNFEYDKLYDELAALEAETGFQMANSPTLKVGYEVVSELQKERHESPMLSLDKTKEPAVLAEFLGEKEGCLSWKMDGLTVVLTYRDGVLYKAVTRGNGEVGEIVTANARTFKNVPLSIDFKGELVIRGEAVIGYDDFDRINEEIGDADARYKNPRNLCSGSVRQLNSEITAQRNVQFYVFSLISAVEQGESVDFHNSVEYQYGWLKQRGFDVVEYERVTADTVEAAVGRFSEKIKTYDLPSDGLVLVFDDIVYGISLGRTAKFPRNGIAFKWKDELAETTLLEIEWSPSRTGLINPVAIFEPVELEGTTVSRASVHNLSIMEGLKLGIGDTIRIFKANMIIPQIESNLTMSGNMKLPDVCPSCGERTEVKDTGEVRTLVCPNPECPAKHVKLFTHFVSRDAMNIDGLSEETLEKFIDSGYIHEFSDIYHLDRYEEAIVAMKGFGQKSYDNLHGAIESSRQTNAVRVLYSLGIPGIGLSNARMIVRELGEDFAVLRRAKKERLVEIYGVGEIMAENFIRYFSDETKGEKLDRLLAEVTIAMERKDETAAILAGKTFVITGTLNHFPNRNACKELIESRGGKVTGSVTSKTDYLINNDAMSQSSKNKKARELGVSVITEEEFLTLAGQI